MALLLPIHVIYPLNEKDYLKFYMQLDLLKIVVQFRL